MKATNAAFPNSYEEGEQHATTGINVRDYIAIQMMAGTLSNIGDGGLIESSIKEIAKEAYRCADVLIAERK